VEVEACCQNIATDSLFGIRCADESISHIIQFESRTMLVKNYVNDPSKLHAATMIHAFLADGSGKSRPGKRFERHVTSVSEGTYILQSEDIGSLDSAFSRGLSNAGTVLVQV